MAIQTSQRTSGRNGHDSAVLRPPRTPLARWAGLGVFALVVVAVAVIGGLAASGSSAEYASLRRPDWAPPSWLFSPVWTTLYAMIAISGWLVWKRAGLDRALIPYGVQLALNAAWTPLFFAAGAYGWALIEIILLWLAIVVNIAAFRPLSRPAALLLVPYLLWVTYATALTAAIWLLNL